MEKKLQKPIQSVERAIKILDCFSLITPSLSLASISEMTGLNINTTRGLVNTLVENQLLLRDADTGNYKLGFYFVSKALIVILDYSSHFWMKLPRNIIFPPACRWFITIKYLVSTVPILPRPLTTLLCLNIRICRSVLPVPANYYWPIRFLMAEKTYWTISTITLTPLIPSKRRINCYGSWRTLPARATPRRLRNLFMMWAALQFRYMMNSVGSVSLCPQLFLLNIC